MKELTEMHSLILRAEEKIESIKEKKLIVVLGITGSGKSTLINFFLKHHLVLKINPDTGIEYIDFAEIPNTPYAKMGHKLADSETLYPEVFNAYEGELMYGDFPGFLSGYSRSVEEQAIELFSTELAIKYSSSVKACVFAIKLSSMSAAGRGPTFKGLFKVITELFKDPEQIKNSLIFVIINDTHRETTEKQVNNIIKEFSTSAQKNKNTDVDILEAIKLLEIASEDNRFRVIDIIKDTHQRDLVLEIIKNKNIPGIKKDQFNFSKIGEARLKFNSIIYELMQKIMDLHKQAKLLSTNIYLTETIVNELNLKLKMEENNLKILNDIQENLKGLREDKKRLVNNEADLKKEILKIDNEVQALGEGIDCVFTDQRTDSVPFYKPFGWFEYKFEYKGNSFDYVEEIPGPEASKGVFKNKKCDRDGGTYNSIYQSPYYSKVDYGIKIYVKNSIRNKDMIAKKTTEKKEKENALVRTSGEIVESINKIEQYEKNEAKNIDGRIVGREEAIKKINKDLKEHQNKSSELDTNSSSIVTLAPMQELILKIINLINFDQEWLVKQFRDFCASPQTLASPGQRPPDPQKMPEVKSKL